MWESSATPPPLPRLPHPVCEDTPYGVGHQQVGWRLTGQCKVSVNYRLKLSHHLSTWEAGTRGLPFVQPELQRESKSSLGTQGIKGQPA